MKYLLRLAVLTFGLTIPLVVASAAEERIHDFFSYIEIGSDGALTVSEVITVTAAGDEIKRGIYRDFPTTYKKPGFGEHRVGFEIIGVMRDGQPISYFTENRSNGIRVYMGSKDVFIRPGTYTYKFTYRTDRQIGFFENFDELYWNVTGNGWSFPIDSATAYITLPEGATALSWDGYTGRSGDKGQSWTSGRETTGQVTFSTTGTLSPGEGFTVAVTWPKGFVAPPTELDRARNMMRDNLVYAVPVGGLFLILMFYLSAWHYVGRDPAKGTIIPRFKPPVGISAAASRFVSRMEFDGKAIGAAIVSLAVKGHLTIENIGKNKYYFHKVFAPMQGKLSAGEKALKRHLFVGGDRATVEKGAHAALKPAVDALKKALSTNFEGAHFVLNIWVTIVGAFLTIVVIGSTVVFGANTMDDSIVFVFIGLIVSGVLLNKLFVWLMKAPTMEGRRLMDQIEGFKMYLSTAEQERLNMLHPPDRTPELFEKYLPYAMALGVETEWGDQFQEVLAAAASGSDGRYSPHWYHGRHHHWHSPSHFASTLGSDLGGAVASAATPPGSSSGSGGGGSSGGGGGGGGGGGF